MVFNEQGEPATASCLAYADAERVVGGAAAAQAARNARGTVCGAKRLLGLRGADPAVAQESWRWLFECAPGGPGDRPLVKGEALVAGWR